MTFLSPYLKQLLLSQIRMQAIDSIDACSGVCTGKNDERKIGTLGCISFRNLLKVFRKFSCFTDINSRKQCKILRDTIGHIGCSEPVRKRI